MAIPGEVTGFALSEAMNGRRGLDVVFNVAGENGVVVPIRGMWMPEAIARELLQQMVKAAIADIATADEVARC